MAVNKARALAVASGEGTPVIPTAIVGTVGGYVFVQYNLDVLLARHPDAHHQELLGFWEGRNDAGGIIVPL